MPSDLIELLEGPDLTPPWTVPGFLVENEVMILAGEAGAGKSLLTYTLAIALATGSNFLGRPMEPKRVLYCDEENPYWTSRQYLRWAYRGLGCPSKTTLVANLCHEALQLTNAGPGGWQARLAQLCQGWKPNLIVIDTATPACHIDDENDNGEATRAVTKLRGAMLSAAKGCSMIVLRHARLEPDTGKYKPRGATAWVGATDCTLLHSYSKGHPATKDPEKAGLRNTKLAVAKVRAFGMREPIWIIPRWIGPEDARGIVLDVKAADPDHGKAD